MAYFSGGMQHGFHDLGVAGAAAQVARQAALDFVNAERRLILEKIA